LSLGETPSSVVTAGGRTLRACKHPRTARCRLIKISESALREHQARPTLDSPEYFCPSLFFHFLAGIRSLSITLQSL
jgi:hypothetical protein